jgi:uncharacterized repeat protein (TIGR01451 family)
MGVPSFADAVTAREPFDDGGQSSKVPTFVSKVSPAASELRPRVPAVTPRRSWHMIRQVRIQARYFSFVFAGLGTMVGCGAEASGEPIASENAALSTSSLIATATLDRAADLAGLSDALENGLPQNVLGGIGSGLAWAGGTTFLGVPDRGPNATSYANGAPVDNTTSFISRFETLELPLTRSTSSTGLPFVLTPTLEATTLLFSEQALVYGQTANLPSAIPSANTLGKSYFTGRSDNFAANLLSTNPRFARLDPEAIRVANDGNTVFISDEYGPFIYQFDRATGKRLRTYALPDYFAISNLNSLGATEISSNTVGRVTNKGIEGLAITPDGSMLVALVQSPLLQDGGDGARPNRIVTIDVASGETHEYVYDNMIGSKAFNSSEIIALNNHQLLIDTRDGKGLGDGSTAVVKQLWAVDLTGAQDVSGLSGQATLLTRAVPKKLFLDIVAVLNANGIVSTKIPAKIEGLAFGKDVELNGTTMHTLYVANDNDFVPGVAGPNLWFVFGFSDADLAAQQLSFTPQQITERGPDLAVTLAPSASSMVTGSLVDYTATVRNTGLVPATNVKLVDALPASLALVSCSSSTSCTASANTATASFSSLAGLASQTATVSARLSCSLPDGAVVNNSVVVSAASPAPTAADDTALATITAVNPAPSITGLVVDKPVLSPPNGKMNTVRVSYSLADNCPGAVCSLAVTSNQGGPADWSVSDAHTVQLRAKRTNDTTRLYTVTVSCVDSGGAVSNANTSVSVLHD